MKVSLIQRLNILTTLLAHIERPVKNLLYRVNRPAKILDRTPIWSEDLVLGRDNRPFNTLEEPSYVRPLSMRDMSHMPEDAETVRAWNPEELIVRQPVDLKQRMRIPETYVLAYVAVQKKSNILPFRHKIFLTV